MKLLLKIAVVICLLGYNIPANAQKQGNVWYFGWGAGMDFNEKPVKALTNGAVFTNEGCASIADENGQILFSTDGQRVYNRNNIQMENGRFLDGDQSSTQSAVVAKKPGSNTVYYIFTVPREGSGPLTFSIVDMTLNGGLGDLVSPTNYPLHSLTTEKITAVKHKNGEDIWIVGNQFQSNKYFAYLITKNGLRTTPVISDIGTKPDWWSANSIGYLKASPDGTKLASALAFQDTWVEISDFNASTGIVSNPVKLTGFVGVGAYGLEFSPNGKLLYITETDIADAVNLYQVALPVLPGDIKTRSTVLGTGINMGALQLAPDGKIYVAQYENSYLHTIAHPNTPGTGAEFRKNTFYLAGKTSRYGLPTFNQSFFSELSFTAQGNCATDPHVFKLETTLTAVDSVVWDFGDPGSGRNNKSLLRDPVHQYSLGGTFVARVTVYHEGITSSYSNNVIVNPVPIVKLGNDTTLFYGQALTLDAKNPSHTYKWNDGSTARTLRVTAPGAYTVVVKSLEGCSAIDTINVHYDQVITTGLRRDTTICVGQRINLNVGMTGATYLWSNGATTPAIDVNTTGQYWVQITNAFQNRVKRDTINVHHYLFNGIVTQEDIIQCDPGSSTLNASGAKAGERYYWYSQNQVLLGSNDGQFTTPRLTSNTSYFVALSNGTCFSAMKQINIRFDKPAAIILTKDTTINVGASVSMAAKGGKTYRWEPALYLDDPTSATPVSKPLDDITYTLTVTNESGCTGTAKVTILIRKTLIIPNAFSPNGDGVHDTWVIKNIEQAPHSLLYVYNRYGEILKKVVGYKNDWDGQHNGKPVPVGVYYYVVILAPDNKMTGSVTVVR